MLHADLSPNEIAERVRQRGDNETTLLADLLIHIIKKMNVAQKQKVVLMLVRRDESARSVARRYGISETTLRRWRDEFIDGGMASLANSRGGDAGLLRQIRRLERELAQGKRGITTNLFFDEYSDSFGPA